MGVDLNNAEWQRHERVFSTQDTHRQITVRNLKAGTRYEFRVACQNDVLTSEWSTSWPSDIGKTVEPNRVTIRPQNLSEASLEGAVPNWRSTELLVRLSTEVADPIHRVDFTSADEGRLEVSCRSYREA